MVVVPVALNGFSAPSSPISSRVPQFEVRELSRDTEIVRIRARSPEEAARIALGLPESAGLKLEKGPDAMDQLEGWKEVRVDGELKGGIRPFQRMRFRRD